MGCNLEKNNSETSIVMIEEAAKNIAKKITKTIQKIQKSKQNFNVLQVPVNPEILQNEALDNAIRFALSQGITVAYSTANTQSLANTTSQQIKAGDWDIL